MMGSRFLPRPLGGSDEWNGHTWWPCCRIGAGSHRTITQKRNLLVQTCKAGRAVVGNAPHCLGRPRRALGVRACAGGSRAPFPLPAGETWAHPESWPSAYCKKLVPPALSSL